MFPNHFTFTSPLSVKQCVDALNAQNHPGVRSKALKLSDHEGAFRITRMLNPPAIIQGRIVENPFRNGSIIEGESLIPWYSPLFALSPFVLCLILLDFRNLSSSSNVSHIFLAIGVVAVIVWAQWLIWTSGPKELERLLGWG